MAGNLQAKQIRKSGVVLDNKNVNRRHVFILRYQRCGKCTVPDFIGMQRTGNYMRETNSDQPEAVLERGVFVAILPIIREKIMVIATWEAA